MDGKASSFQTTPVPRRGQARLSIETSVPVWATPGADILAYGLHAGTRKLFRAQVVNVRAQFPRIVVKYISTLDGTGTHTLQLPELQTAYLTSADIQQLA